MAVKFKGIVYGSMEIQRSINLTISVLTIIAKQDSATKIIQ
jgi:hypothetical protein